MYEIFKARNEFAQCLISSALLMSVTRIGAMKGSYTFFIKSIACSLCAPITIRSGCMRSATAQPSRKNSGLLTTSNFAPWRLYRLIDSATFSPVFTGTVLLSTITR